LETDDLAVSHPVARRLLDSKDAMQIPYDLEFVQSRPPVRPQAIALRKSPDSFPAEGSRRAPDTFDAILEWIHRVLRRLESR
jgi:hypothetical protein